MVKGKVIEAVTFVGEMVDRHSKTTVNAQTGARSQAIEIKVKTPESPELAANLSRLAKEAELKVTIEVVQSSLEL